MKLQDEAMPTGDIYNAPELSPEELNYLLVKMSPLGHLIDVIETKGMHIYRQPVPISELLPICTAYAIDVHPDTRLTVITYNDLFRGVAWSAQKNKDVVIAHLFGTGPDVRFRIDAEIRKNQMSNMAIYGVHTPVIADIKQGRIVSSHPIVAAEEMVVFMGCVAHTDQGYIFGANLLPADRRQ